MQDSFKISTEIFEGPLDLLLSLVEKRKLFINEVSLSKVADDFIAYLESLEDFPMKESAEFILIASTLLLIKSRSLLPTLKLTDEEQSTIEDLEDRLSAYRRIKELSIYVRRMYGTNRIFFGPSRIGDVKVFSPDQSINIQNIILAIDDVIKNLPKEQKLSQVTVKKVISLEDTMTILAERIQSNLKMSFKEFSSKFSGDKTELREKKVHIVMGFLAMLELVKRGIIRVAQERNFDDIAIESQNIGVPSY